MRLVPGSEISSDEHERQAAALLKLSASRKRLDPASFVSLLAEDAVYEAQSILRPIVGREAIAAYLVERFEFLRTVQRNHDIGRLALAVVDLPRARNHPCLVFEIDGARQAIWVIQLDDRNRIKRVDILTVCPSPSEARLIH